MQRKQIHRVDLEKSNLMIVDIESRIEAQRALIEKALKAGRDCTQARKLLGIMLDSLHSARERRRQILRDLALRDAEFWSR